MNARLLSSTETSDEWTRVSSFRPLFAAMLLILTMGSACILLFDGGKQAVPLITAGILVSAGLIALNCKVVYKRGNEYRITTLFYTELVTVDDVCMTVTNPGPLWTKFRIHLRRPARFGWMVSFVPADRALIGPQTRE